MCNTTEKQFLVGWSSLSMVLYGWGTKRGWRIGGKSVFWVSLFKNTFGFLKYGYGYAKQSVMTLGEGNSQGGGSCCRRGRLLSCQIPPSSKELNFLSRPILCRMIIYVRERTLLDPPLLLLRLFLVPFFNCILIGRKYPR